MLVLGLILILIAAGVLVAMLFSGSTGAQVTMFAEHLHASALIFFLAGAATLLVFIMGLELVRAGLRRANRNRKNTKRLRRLERREAPRREEASPPAEAVTAGPTGSAAPQEQASAGAPPAVEPKGTDPAARAADGPYQNPPPAR
jgi:hypothetical protein